MTTPPAAARRDRLVHLAVGVPLTAAAVILNAVGRAAERLGYTDVSISTGGDMLISGIRPADGIRLPLDDKEQPTIVLGGEFAGGEGGFTVELDGREIAGADYDDRGLHAIRQLVIDVAQALGARVDDRSEKED